MSWHGWLIKVCVLRRFQRSLVGSHWIGLTSQKWGSQSGSREAGRQRAGSCCGHVGMYPGTLSRSISPRQNPGATALLQESSRLDRALCQLTGGSRPEAVQAELTEVIGCVSLVSGVWSPVLGFRSHVFIIILASTTQRS